MKPNILSLSLASLIILYTVNIPKVTLTCKLKNLLV